jgi:large subunit ribosomal protein L25
MMYELAIACLPRDIPHVITVDLSAFEVGETLHAGDIALPQGVSLVGNVDDTVVTALIPTAAEELEQEEAEAAAEAEAEATAEAEAEAADGPSESAPEA